MIAELLAALFFVATASGGGIPLLREARHQAQRSLTNSTSHVDDATRHLEVNSAEYLHMFATHASSQRFFGVMIIVHFAVALAQDQIVRLYKLRTATARQLVLLLPVASFETCLIAAHCQGPDGECGPSYGSCGGVRCCSRYNWCSTGDAYCGAGCQAAYGTCAAAVGELYLACSLIQVQKHICSTVAALALAQALSVQVRKGLQQATRIPLGCYGDAASRDLTTQLSDMGMPDCVKACYTSGFKYAGSQYGFQVSTTSSTQCAGGTVHTSSQHSSLLLTRVLLGSFRCVRF
eukprot:2012-Heterococcus_DN1.PRE.3